VAGLKTGRFHALYPEESWNRSERKDLGWSVPKLTDVAQYLQTIPEGSLMVIDKGRIVDPGMKVNREAR